MSNKINFIINSLEPYQYEIVNFLALPKGSLIRLRYDKKWLDDDSINRQSLNKGMDGYLFFCHKISDDLSEYYPIRKIKYVDFQKFGKIHYFTLEVFDYFDYPENFSIIKNDIKITNKNLVFCDTKNRSLKAEEFNNILDDDDVLDNNKWVRTVENLLKINAFNQLDFYRISKICYLDNKGDVKTSVVENGVLTLNQSTSYDISITQLRDSGSSADRNESFDATRGIKFISSKNLFVSKGFSMAVGKYDILKLNFSTDKVKSDFFGTIFLEFSIPNKLKKIMDNSINIPFILKKEKINYKGRLSIAALFIFLYILPILSFIPTTGFNQEWLKLISTISIIGFTVTLNDLLNEYRSLR